MLYSWIKQCCWQAFILSMCCLLYDSESWDIKFVICHNECEYRIKVAENLVSYLYLCIWEIQEKLKKVRKTCWFYYHLFMDPAFLSFSHLLEKITLEKCLMNRLLHGWNPNQQSNNNNNNNHPHLPIKIITNNNLIITTTIIIPMKIAETAKYIEIPDATIVIPLPRHYGDVMMMAIIYVMPVASITNYTMYIALCPWKEQSFIDEKEFTWQESIPSKTIRQHLIPLGPPLPSKIKIPHSIPTIDGIACPL